MQRRLRAWRMRRRRSVGRVSASTARGPSAAPSKTLSQLVRAVVGLLLSGCAGGELDMLGSEGSGGQAVEYRWDLPEGFPVPPVPADNPMTADKVELGRRLFYDRRLSEKQTYACSSCHHPQLAFTDRRGRGVGESGEL